MEGSSDGVKQYEEGTSAGGWVVERSGGQKCVGAGETHRRGGGGGIGEGGGSIHWFAMVPVGGSECE